MVARYLNLRLLLVLGLVAVLVFLAAHLDLARLTRQALERIAALGALAPAAYVVFYILACVLFLPGSVLTVGAGVLFGLLPGVLLTLAGATLGATGAFLVGRYLAREWVERRLEGAPKFKALDRAVAAEGFKIVFLARLSPVIPFNLLNYGLGLTQVRLKDYFFASLFGIIPGTTLYVYLGSLARDLATAGSGARSRSPAVWALDILGFAATVAVVVYVTRLAARALGRTQ